MKLFTTTLVAILVLLTHGTVYATGYDSEMNHPSYWGEDCYKIDISGEVYSYTVNNADATKVIVKGGTTNKVYTVGPFTNVTAQTNPRSSKPYGISHVIVCADKVETPSNQPSTGNGVVSDQAATTTRGVQGTTTGKGGGPTELPKTGAFDVATLGIGAVVSMLAGVLSRKRR